MRLKLANGELATTDNIFTLSHASLGVKRILWMIVAWWVEHADLARETWSQTTFWAALSSTLIAVVTTPTPPPIEGPLRRYHRD